MMATKLTKADKAQLKKWDAPLGGLLYKASVDGCDASTFNQKCDNQGPTVTILYNTANYVFGGVTFVNWTGGSGSYASDPKAFLFRLQANGSAKYMKYPCTNTAQAICCNGSFGPIFGAGHDLISFRGSHNKVNNTYFQVDGHCNLGTSYDAQGENAANFTGNNFQLTDIEVYKIGDSGAQACILDTPWRETSEEPVEKIKKDIEDYAPVEGLKMKHTKVLLVGPIGAGKSSFFNTINSIFRGHVTSQACSGSSEHSLTTMYRMYNVRSPATGQPMKFRLCDTMGLEETQGLDSNDLASILDGHVPDRYQFNPLASISPETPGYKKSPSLEDKIHCLAFVIDGCSVDIFPEKILDKIKSIRQKANQRGIPQAILLTKVDKLCPEVENDVGAVLKSEAVEETVDRVANLVGLPRGHVLPIKNYEREINLLPAIDHLALLSLRAMLRFADDLLYNYLDQQEGY